MMPVELTDRRKTEPSLAMKPVASSGGSILASRQYGSGRSDVKSLPQPMSIASAASPSASPWRNRRPRIDEKRLGSVASLFGWDLSVMRAYTSPACVETPLTVDVFERLEQLLVGVENRGETVKSGSCRLLRPRLGPA